MNQATLKEYVAARSEFIEAVRGETASKILTQKARFRFNAARSELRAEEHEMLTEFVDNIE